MTLIGANLQALRQRVAEVAKTCGRDASTVRLLAVSKTFGAETVADAYENGQRAFGENYVQEAVAKILRLRHLLIEWHFIGPIQSNKTIAIAEHFSWVHSVDRIRIAQRLSDARPSDLAPLQVCLQVNIGGESSKSGVAPQDVLSLARQISKLPRLMLRGLMTIPPASDEPAMQRAYFAQLRRLKDEVVNAGIVLDTLSMGMSNDLDSAIQEGSTLVRVGTAIFGKRQSK